MCARWSSRRPSRTARRDHLVRGELGQTMVEYVLMLLLIALVVISAIPTVAAGIGSAFAKIAAAFGG